ncbi:MAG: DedA family protein [Opitutaceae bacterium]|jgi:membrane protein DedA with SNARE-associated domain
MHEAIAKLLAWYADSLQTGGYPLIILLMAIESSVIPVPSEFVIPPAAYLAYSQGHMSLPGVVLAGAFGSWIGATIMYWVSRLAGRPLVIRYGRYVFISPEKIESAERWSARYGNFGVFVSRLLPVVRHLIGIPFGIVRLNYAKYSLYTLLGSLAWCVVLSWVGVLAGNDKALMAGDMKEVTLWIVAAVVVLSGLYYFFVHRQMRRAA